MRSSGAVRAAVPADSDAMAVIDALASESPWSAAQFRKACENTGENAGECALVFDSGAGAIGFVVFSTVLDEATILNIVVHPQQQRQGVASHLLQALLAVLSVGPARRCLLEVRASILLAKPCITDLILK